MADLIAHLNASVRRTEAADSRIFLEDVPIYGMSGRKGRALLNNICSVPWVRYLEVGLWQGSTFFSALKGNKIRAMGIDNWSEFHGEDAKKVFLKYLPDYLGENDVSFGEGDCFGLVPESSERFNVLFYDGGHSELDHYRVFSRLGPVCMDREFIIVIDDLAAPEVSGGTKKAVYDLGYEVLNEHVLGLDQTHSEDPDQYWNGMLAMVVRRP